jgi:formate/nitrite transporter
MNLFTPAEIVHNYSEAGLAKTEKPAGRLLVLAVAAGLMVALAAAASSTAAHSLDSVSAARTVSGLLFPFGLAMILLTGAELFTGSCLMGVSLLDKKIRLGPMLRCWGVVYLGNFAGALLTAAGCAFFGQFAYSQNGLAVYTVRLAAAKCALSFPAGLVSGIFCNILVCVGVLCGLSAKDTAGRVLGAFVPVSLFVVCGFEHSVANMYYIPAGLFALRVPAYAAAVSAAGLDVSALTWGRFLWGNLLPVTLGNIIGGLAVAGILWFGHKPKK